MLILILAMVPLIGVAVGAAWGLATRPGPRYHGDTQGWP